MATIKLYLYTAINDAVRLKSRKAETLESYFERYRSRGYNANKGNPTFMGLSLDSYKEYCLLYHLPEPTREDLKSISFATWQNALKEIHWDAMKCDDICNQHLAGIMMDYSLLVGCDAASRNIQELIRLNPTGKITGREVALINGASPLYLYGQIRTMYVNDRLKKVTSEKEKADYTYKINSLSYGN